MRPVSTVSKITLVLAAAIIAGVSIGYFSSRRPASRPGVDPSALTDATPEATSTPPGLTASVSSDAARTNLMKRAGFSPTLVRESVEDLTATNADGQTVWEKKLDDILLGEENEAQKADKILALIPRVPEEAQIELSQHLVNLTADDHYAGASQLLTNAELSEAVLNVLMTDLMNRDNKLKLPLILNIARIENHPLHNEARETLELYLQEDYGNDWDKWDQGVQKWLAETEVENTEPAPAK